MGINYCTSATSYSTCQLWLHQIGWQLMPSLNGHGLHGTYTHICAHSAILSLFFVFLMCRSFSYYLCRTATLLQYKFGVRSVLQRDVSGACGLLCCTGFESSPHSASWHFNFIMALISFFYMISFALSFIISTLIQTFDGATATISWRGLTQRPSQRATQPNFLCLILCVASFCPQILFNELHFTPWPSGRTDKRSAAIWNLLLLHLIQPNKYDAILLVHIPSCPSAPIGGPWQPCMHKCTNVWVCDCIRQPPRIVVPWVPVSGNWWALQLSLDVHSSSLLDYTK